MTRQPGDTDPGRRPPDYVIVVAASDWLKDRFPAVRETAPAVRGSTCTWAGYVKVVLAWTADSGRTAEPKERSWDCQVVRLV